MNLTPIVIEQSGHGERSYDIYSRLLMDRIVVLFGEINDYVSQSIIAQLLYLTSVDKDKPIYLYINSPGGMVTSGLAIYDTIKFIEPNVYTIGMGMCASMGAFLLACGDKRYCLPSTKIMIHQPLGNAKGQATDMMIIAEEIIKTKRYLNEILSQVCNKDLKIIEHDVERDYYMTATDALAYGIIDDILTSKDNVK